MSTNVRIIRTIAPAAVLLAAVAAASMPYGTVPLAFEANEGQTDRSVDFVARGSGYALAVRATDVTIGLRGAPGDGGGTRTAHVRMRIAGAAPTARAEGLDLLPGTANYFGGTPMQWLTRIQTYGRVRYSDVLPGVDVVYYGNQRRLEFDFVVRPGVDPSALALGFDGVDGVALDPEGGLLLTTAGGTLRQHAPVVYQEVDGARRTVAGAYRLLPGGQVGFEIDAYDRSRALVIDPVLSYSTFLGGSANDLAAAVAVDAAGNAFVAGYTASVNFPTTPGAFQSVDPNMSGYAGGAIDAFVARFAADGTLVYSTYLGGAVGSGLEARNSAAYGLTIDGSGNAYVVGGSGEDYFPITPDAYQPTKSAFFDQDAFVSKLSPDGTQLLYSTFLGGHGLDQASAIALDADRNMYVVGGTNSADFPTANALQPTFAGPAGDDWADAFVAKLNAAGSALVYSTYLGGSGREAVGQLVRPRSAAVAVDTGGNAYVSGDTGSADFPTTPGAFQPSHANPGNDSAHRDGFLTKIGPTGSLVYSTFLGGQTIYGRDSIFGVAVDTAGHAYVTGYEESGDFPLVNPLPGLPVSGNGFVTKFSTDGSSLVFSTTLGCSGMEPSGIALGPDGQVYVAGQVYSGLPLVCGAPASGGGDAFMLRLAVDGSAILGSTYLGGSANDIGAAIAVDPAGNVIVAGATLSGNFPTASAVQATPGGEWDAFVTKIAPTACQPEPPSVTCPGNVTVTAPIGATSRTVTFDTASASGVSPCLSSAPCVPASGSSFPVGNTTVTCTARDVTGLSASCSFTVTVNGQATTTTTTTPVTTTTQPPSCGNGILDPGEVCDDGLGSGAPGVRDGGDDVDSCPNGPALVAFGVACRVTQHCGDAVPFLIDSSSRCVGSGCASTPLEACDNGGGTVLVNGVPVPAPKTCRNAGGLFCNTDADCGASGPCGNSNTAPGACTTTCQLPADDDGDGIPNAFDVCPFDVENDADADGVCEHVDNCDTIANPGQADIDGDHVGDACDPDIDGDGVPNGSDNCPYDVNPGQADYDHDGAGDACDADDDGDGVLDAVDACLPSPPGQPVNAAGCTIGELCPCAHPQGQDCWKNHGAYVSCVAHAANDFLAAGLITSAQHGTIVSVAGESSCGKK